MNSLVAAIAEKIAQLEGKRRRWNTRGQHVYLYTNAHTPTPYDVLADYTATLVQGITYQAASWPFPASDNGDGTASVRGAYLLYQPTGTGVVENILGCYFIDATSGLFQFGQRFTTPLLAFGATLNPLVVPLIYSDDDIP